MKKYKKIFEIAVAVCDGKTTSVRIVEKEQVIIRLPEELRFISHSLTKDAGWEIRGDECIFTPRGVYGYPNFKISLPPVWDGEEGYVTHRLKSVRFFCEKEELVDRIKSDNFFLFNNFTNASDKLFEAVEKLY